MIKAMKQKSGRSSLYNEPIKLLELRIFGIRTLIVFFHNEREEGGGITEMKACWGKNRVTGETFSLSAVGSESWDDVQFKPEFIEFEARLAANKLRAALDLEVKAAKKTKDKTNRL